MKKNNSVSDAIKNVMTNTFYLKFMANIKAIRVVLTFAIIITFSSCTTTQMTISPQAFKSATDNVQSDITSIETGYELSGSGSESKNEVKVTGQSYSQYTGYGTLMDNDISFYDNYTYTDSEGNTIEYQLKYKRSNDYYGQEFIYDVEVTKCNCGDKKIYSVVCGNNGIVKKITQITFDQQSVFFNKGKTYGAVFGITLGVSLIPLLFLLAL